MSAPDRPSQRPVALVTGASSGIGEAFARRLAADGHDLVVVARSADALERLAAELGSSVAVEVLAADLTKADELGRIEQRLREPGNRPVELLVNNAGFGTTGRFDQLPVDGEDEEIRLNVTALVRLAHAALPAMVANRSGGVINVSSIASFQPTPGTATYGATKAFVTSFTLALHEEMRPLGVNAMVLCPGATRTQFQERADYQDSWVPRFAWQTPDEVAAAALSAYRRGAPICTPGWTNKALAAGTHLAPKRLLARVAGLVSGQV